MPPQTAEEKICSVQSSSITLEKSAQVFTQSYSVVVDSLQQNFKISDTSAQVCRLAMRMPFWHTQTY
jgi:hypothetical protein